MLSRAAMAYNDAVGSYDRSVRPSGERIVKLGADAGSKTLAAPESVTVQLRPPPAAEKPPTTEPRHVDLAERGQIN